MFGFGERAFPFTASAISHLSDHTTRYIELAVRKAFKIVVTNNRRGSAITSDLQIGHLNIADVGVSA